ncbi:NLR family CARD domain-containing protein 4-like [Patiria miniata]|uniref:Uncharacterized protein n=1 Tax=Patiria miniata TaxID=46514 RepID=A0A914BK66_PATMI|nr:NLR family CARD domain-containing protein 4-like [Patiria miniata]
MQQDRLGRRGRARIIAEEYNHSLSKLVGTKRRVKPSRKAAFMAAFPVKASPRLHSDKEGASVLPLKEASVTHLEHGETDVTEETNSKTEVESPVEVRQKLQVFVRGLLLPKTLCLQLDPETSVSDLKALVERESGIQPQDQRLYIGIHFQLCDLLSIRDHGIHQDQNIELRAGGLLGGGPLEECILNLSRKLGKDWRLLARLLDFKGGEIDVFQENNRGDLREQIYQMLDAWLKKQDNPADAPEKLKAVLEDMGRADLASQVPSIAGPRFDVEQCARELAAHYRETMKVSTHPKEKHMAREMDDIYVNPQLLQETNIPVLSSEAKMQAETGRHSEHLKASKQGTPDAPKSQSDKDKGLHVQTISLDSYKDMLKLEGNRLLIRAEAGFGKTTLLKRIAYDWADLKIKGGQTENQQQSEHASVLGRYELIFVVEVNRMGKTFNIIDAIFSQILTHSKLKKTDLEKYIQENQESVLILLDGADEIFLQRIKDAQCNISFDLNGVLSFKSLKSCKVIVTSRQKTANELLNMHAYYTNIIMVGFDEKDRDLYLRKYLANFESKNQNSFLEKVNGSETLRSLAKIPLFMWLMCHTWANKGQLPDQITSLFRDNIHLLFLHQASKETDEQVSDTKTLISKLGRIALEGLLDPNGERLHFLENEIDSKDLDIFERGSDVGLLSKRKTVQGLEIVFHFSFPHKTFQEYCAAVYLVDLLTTDKEAFDQYLSCILHGDVESLEYVLRFCCGLNTDAAEVILRRIGDLLKQNRPNKSMHRILMQLLFEAQSESLVKCFVETGKVAFPYELQGEVLVAAHYFFKVGSNHTTLLKTDQQEINATCRDLADFRLLEDIMTHIQCKPSLNLVINGISWDSFEDKSMRMLKSKRMMKCLKSLHVANCDWKLGKLFQVLSKSYAEIDTLTISGRVTLDTLSNRTIKPVTSMKKINLFNCSLTNSDIQLLFSLLSALGSIQRVDLGINNLHGLQPVPISAVPSLSELYIYECGLTNSDMEPLFSLLSAAGSIKTLTLKGNKLNGLQPTKTTTCPSLSELNLWECGLTSSDIKPPFRLLSAAGSVKKLVLKGENLHDRKPSQITAVPSLSELHLDECGLTKSDIQPLFSFISAAGSVKTLALKGNNLHGLQPEGITAISSLTELHLDDCGLTKTDIRPLFSLLAAAGSIKTLALTGNNLHGLQPEEITVVPSLSKLHLHGCGLENIDIEPLFYIVSAAGSVKTLVLQGMDLHGLQSGTISAVPCLSQLSIYACGLTSSDIMSLYQLLSAADNAWTFILNGYTLQGLQLDEITAILNASL